MSTGRGKELVDSRKQKQMIDLYGWINPNRKLKTESICEWI